MPLRTAVVELHRTITIYERAVFTADVDDAAAKAVRSSDGPPDCSDFAYAVEQAVPLVPTLDLEWEETGRSVTPRDSNLLSIEPSLEAIPPD